MPTKRRQPHEELSTNWPSGIPLKKIKIIRQPARKATLSAASKTKRPADEYADDASTTLLSSRSTKKMKTTPKSAPKTKQHAASQTSSVLTTTLPSKKQPAPKAHTAIPPSEPATSSPLVPHIPRQRATVGHKDESLLHIVGRSTKIGKSNDLRFRLIPHSSIDWNNAQHIAKINSWRNQIYQRAGIKTRLIVSWHELEELWMELYYHFSIAEARKRSIQLPTPKRLRNAFNAMFEGRVLQHRHGGDLEPRSKRHATAFGSKFNRMFPVLKGRLHGCVDGKGAEIFMPEITFGMLLPFEEKKVEMADKGIKTDSEDVDDMEEWQHFLTHLLDNTDTDTVTKTQDLAQDEEEDEVAPEDDEDLMREEQEEKTRGLTAQESDVVVALVSLANLPADAQVSSPSNGSSQSHTTQPK